MGYQLILAKSVQKELKKIDQKYQNKIDDALVYLKTDPYIGKLLRGNYFGFWSLRVWPYRIIYRIHENMLIVVVIHIRHRQGAYK